jgi:replicative DNA helicase
MENLVDSRIKPIIMPRKPEIELRVLAGLAYLGDPKSKEVQKAMLELNSECFYDGALIQIFEILSQLFKSDEDMSFVNLLGTLPPKLHLYAEEALKLEYYTGKYLEQDIKQLQNLRTLRLQIKLAINAVNSALDCIIPEEAIYVISESLKDFNKTFSSHSRNIIVPVKDLIEEILNAPEDICTEFKLDIPGLPPIPNQALITIAGRSGHGKTFFALYLMDKIIDIRPGRQSLYFNLEMNKHTMVERHARILGFNGRSRHEIVSQAKEQLLDKNLSIISEPTLTIEEIEIECRLAAMRQPLAVIVVDYLGLIRSKVKSERKDLEQSDIAKRLAALSLQFDCIVIGLIQVNRDSKTRGIGDKCPIPSDSSESMGSVHSSSWWLGIDQPQVDSDDPEWENMFNIHCRKNRFESGLFHLKLKFKNGMFSKWERPFSSNYNQSKADITPGF